MTLRSSKKSPRIPQSQLTRVKPRFDKHYYYNHSVQSAEHDAELLYTILKKLHSKNPPASPILQEDFCGSAALCYEWAKLSRKHRATGIDLDPEALAWGTEHFESELDSEVVNRVNLIHGDVMDDYKIKPNIICALNFSYSIFKQRSELIRYLKSRKKSLAKGGILVLDSFGGPGYQLPHVDRRRNSEEKFNFWWEVESFDAVSHAIRCHIHFQRDGETTRKKVFSYDWRLWSIPELTDALHECGFGHVEYWAEGLDKQGCGNGKFKTIKQETNCETWMTYIVAK